MTTCSATETTLEPETSATVILRSLAALRSMWLEQSVTSAKRQMVRCIHSEPTPAVTQSLRFLALAMISLVR